MAIHKTQGIVISRYDVRETSLIVNFFTLDYGRITGLLKGIRNDPAKFGSKVEQFSCNDIIFYPNRGSGVHLVSQCDLKDNFYGIRKDVLRINLAGIAMEILSSIMAQEDKNEEVFRLALTALNELSNNYDPAKIITIFKIKILALSGFKPHLDSCVVCGQRIMQQSRFSLNLGGLLCFKCANKDTSARQIFRGTVATIQHIEKNDFNSNLKLGMNPQIKKELEMVLNAFINFHLEKELKSQKVLNKMEAYLVGDVSL